MCWGRDGFRHLIPITFFESSFMEQLCKFIENPQRWEREISTSQKEEYLNLLKQELNRKLLEFARERIIYENKPEWEEALGYSGRGSAYKRMEKIKEIFKKAVPH